MFRASIAAGILGLLAADPRQDFLPSHEKELGPLAFLVGTFEGEGKSLLGPYRETMTGEWAAHKTVIVIRSRSVAGETTVFEDLRVISYDNAKKRLRMRQYAMGDLAEYDIDVHDEGKTLVFRETAHEGRGRPEWRYTLTVPSSDAFSYTVEDRHGGSIRPYVSGSLKRKK